MFHSSPKLTISDLDIDEGFKSMHQSIMANIKNYASKNWIVIERITKDSLKIFECLYKQRKIEIISTL